MDPLESELPYSAEGKSRSLVAHTSKSSQDTTEMLWNSLVPELVVAGYERSKVFYVDVFGFSVRFERPESSFGYFDLGGAQIMLLQDTNRPIYQMHRSGPKGKGLHFQVEIPSIPRSAEGIVDCVTDRMGAVDVLTEGMDRVLEAACKRVGCCP